MSEMPTNLKRVNKQRGSFTQRLFDNRLHRFFSVMLIIVLCTVINYFYFASNNQIGGIYENETRTVIIELKKVFLKNTVDNLIQEIETRRNFEREHYKNVVNQRYASYQSRSFTSNDFVQTLITDLHPNNEPQNDAPQWTVFIWGEDGTVIYDPEGFAEGDIATTIEKVKPLMSHYRVMHQGNISGLFGFSQKYVDDTVKAAIAVKIKNLYYGDDSYIWVNEIVNYEGGENYAIRLIHPNLPDTEGMHLSTDMTDIKGNLPYLTELQGVKKDGELFSSYYFKELNSDNISEKLTYAKLFKDFNWIIAMGIQNNEMEKYINATNEKSKALALARTLQLLAILTLAVILCFVLIILLEKWRRQHDQKHLELELRFDPLTNAKSRRYGTMYLEKTFSDYHTNNSTANIAVMLLDIDNFKFINDHYGHSEGDRILKEIVPAIYKAIRSSDELFRWGGDEFVGVFQGANSENMTILAEKILAAVTALKLNPEIILDNQNISVSIGISHFREEDKDYSDALKRADQAMYLSKAQGGNNFTIA